MIIASLPAQIMGNAKHSPRVSFLQDDMIRVAKYQPKRHQRKVLPLASCVSILLLLAVVWTVSFLHKEEVALADPSSRPRMSSNEFYVKDNPFRDAELAQFFGLLEQIEWSTSFENSTTLQKISLTNTKLIIPHIPRTGISVILTMFQVFSKAKDIAMGTVAHCWDVSAPSMMHETAIWTNGRDSYGEGRPCALFMSVDSDSDRPAGMTTTSLKSKLHVLGGQLSYLGSAQDIGDTLPPVQYIFLMREPRYRVLSEIAAHRLSVDFGTIRSDPRQVAERCVDFIRTELSNDRYSGGVLMNSLIAPHQKEFVHYYKLRWTNERRTGLAMKNIRQSHGTMVFGSMRDMNATLDLVSYAVPEIPQSLVSYVRTGLLRTESISSVVWDVLTSQERTLVDNYTTWEQRVYDLAMVFHKDQVEFVKGQNN